MVLRFAGCNVQEGTGLRWPSFLLEDESMVILFKMLKMTGFELEITLTKSDMLHSKKNALSIIIVLISRFGPSGLFLGLGWCLGFLTREEMGHFTITFGPFF